MRGKIVAIILVVILVGLTVVLLGKRIESPLVESGVVPPQSPTPIPTLTPTPLPIDEGTNLQQVTESLNPEDFSVDFQSLAD